jgi:hypothetical protein
MTKSNLKKYTEPQMEVVAIEYQNLIAVSNIINPDEEPIGPAKGREYDDDMLKLLEENFLL